MGATKFIKSFFKKYTEQDVPINLDLWPAINSRFQNSGEEVSNGSSGADHHGSQKSLMERVPEVIRKSTVLISPKKKENSMEKEKQGGGVRVTRRNFLKVSGATVAGTAMFGAIRKPVLRSLIELFPRKKQYPKNRSVSAYVDVNAITSANWTCMSAITRLSRSLQLLTLIRNMGEAVCEAKLSFSEYIALNA